MCGLITHFQTANHRKGCPDSSSKRRSRRTQASPSPRRSSWGRPAAVRRRCTSSTCLDLVDIGRLKGKSWVFPWNIGRSCKCSLAVALCCSALNLPGSMLTQPQSKHLNPQFHQFLKDRRYSKYGSRYGKNTWRKSSCLPTWWNGWSSPGYIGKNIGGYRGRFSILLLIVYLKGPTDYMGDRSTT